MIRFSLLPHKAFFLRFPNLLKRKSLDLLLLIATLECIALQLSVVCTTGRAINRDKSVILIVYLFCFLKKVIKFCVKDSLANAAVAQKKMKSQKKQLYKIK